MYLSANTAKLVALLLNTLYGIIRYAETDEATPSVDLVFGLRVIQGESARLADQLSTRDPPSGIVDHLRAITNRARSAAESLGNRTRIDSPIQYEKLHRLLEQPYALFQKHSERSADPRLIWSARTMFSSNLTDQISNQCITELYTTDGDCRPSKDCLEVMLHTKNLANYALSRQLIYFTIASRHKLCRKAILSYWSMNQSAMSVHLNELCSNVIHETHLFLSRAPKDLVGLTPLQKDLLMQHVFVCGQHGFTDVVRPRLLWMTLGQQSETGCFPLPANDAPPEIGRRLLAVVSPRPVGCSAHSTSVAAGASMVFLNFLLSSSNWADFHLSDTAFTVPHQEIAENRFAEVNWQVWTKDRSSNDNNSDAPMGEPPAIHSIKSDLISLIVIFLGIFVLIAAITSYCGRSPKQTYAYSYKKL